MQLQLNEDLVAATVKLDSANRRVELLEREKERLMRSMDDAQVWTGELRALYNATVLACLISDATFATVP